MNKLNAREWMVDQRFSLLQKYKQLGELREHFPIEEEDLLNVLTSHAVLLYLDEYPGPIFEVYEAFETEDLGKIVYGTDAETQAIVEAGRQSAGNANDSGDGGFDFTDEDGTVVQGYVDLSEEYHDGSSGQDGVE